MERYSVRKGERERLKDGETERDGAKALEREWEYLTVGRATVPTPAFRPDLGTYKTVRTGFWPWLSGKNR